MIHFCESLSNDITVSSARSSQLTERPRGALGEGSLVEKPAVVASVPVLKRLTSVRGVLSEHPNEIAVSSARRVSTDSTAERRRRGEGDPMWWRNQWQWRTVASGLVVSRESTVAWYWW